MQLLSSFVCLKGSSFSLQVDDNFIWFCNLFLPSEVFLPLRKHEILSSLEPSTANPRANDFMELIIISFDRLSHACRTHWTILRRGTGFILPAVVYSRTPLAKQSSYSPCIFSLNGLLQNKSGACIHLFLINNPFLTFAPKTVYAFLKSRPKKLFSNCLVDGLLTAIV